MTIKVGITPNIYVYAGFYVGGSLILAAGISGFLTIQAGLGADPANVPLANLTTYGFHRIRHYGLLASSAHKEAMALARRLLGVAVLVE